VYDKSTGVRIEQLDLLRLAPNAGLSTGVKKTAVDNTDAISLCVLVVTY